MNIKNTIGYLNYQENEIIFKDYIELETFNEYIKFNQSDILNSSKKINNYCVYDISELDITNWNHINALNSDLFKIIIYKYDKPILKSQGSIAINLEKFKSLINNKNINQYEDIHLPNASYIYTKLKDKLKSNQKTNRHHLISNIIKNSNMDNILNILEKKKNSFYNCVNYTNKIIINRSDIVRFDNIWIDIIKKKIVDDKPDLYHIECTLYGRIFVININLATIMMQQIKKKQEYGKKYKVIALSIIEYNYWNSRGYNTILWSNFISNQNIEQNIEKNIVDIDECEYILISIATYSSIDKNLKNLIDYFKVNNRMDKISSFIISKSIYSETHLIINYFYSAKWLNGKNNFIDEFKNIYINNDKLKDNLVFYLDEKTYDMYFNMNNSIKPLYIRPSIKFIKDYNDYINSNTNNMETGQYIVDSVKTTIIIPPIQQKLESKEIPILNELKYNNPIENKHFNCNICMNKCSINDLLLYQCKHYICFQCFVQTITYTDNGDMDLYFNDDSNLVKPFKCPFCNQEHSIRQVYKLVKSFKPRINFIKSLYQDYGKIYQLSGYLKTNRFIRDFQKISSSSEINIILNDNICINNIFQYIVSCKGIRNIIFLTWNNINYHNINDNLDILIKLIINIRKISDKKCVNKSKKNEKLLKINIYIMDPDTRKPIIRKMNFTNLILILYSILLSHNHNLSYKVFQYVIKNTVDEMIFKNQIVYTR